MTDITGRNFGVVIAFWLPGFILLWGLSYSSDEISALLGRGGNADDPTVGGFLYVTLASLALGMLISAVRWMLVDQFIYRFTGLKYDPVDFSKLKEKDTFAAFSGIIENHYRHYQYYSNTLVAIVAALLTYRISSNGGMPVSMWLALLLIIVALALASRDSLKKYHERTAALQKK